jgi:hypothetical protein
MMELGYYGGELVMDRGDGGNGRVETMMETMTERWRQ